MERYINISLLLYLLMVKENDFTGKTVIPFFTSASNTFGNSCEILENIVEGGKWQDGKDFHLA